MSELIPIKKIPFWAFGKKRIQEANKLLFTYVTYSIRVEQTSYALSKGADPNYINEHGKTPLQDAADDHFHTGEDAHGFNDKNKNLIMVLLGAGADPNLESGSGYTTPLMYAIANHNHELVELLLNAGAAVTEDHVNTIEHQEKYDKMSFSYLVHTLVMDAAQESGLLESIKERIKEKEHKFKILSSELFEILEEAWFWGIANDFPLLDEYPQVANLKLLGNKLRDLGPDSRDRALLFAKDLARQERDYLGGYTAVANKAWGLPIW